MKKQTLKNLALRKNTISKLDKQASIQGGAAFSMLCPSGGPNCITKSHIFVCCPQEPLPASNPEICTGPYGNCPINI